MNVFNSPTCPYDMVLGIDFLQVIGMNFDYELDVIQWLKTIMDMKNVHEFNNLTNIEDTGLQPNDSACLNQL